MEKKEITEGSEAPLFKLDSYNAGNIDLASLIGDQKIVLIFSRYFGCPICQVDFKELLKRKAEIEEKNAKILYITQSGEKIAKEYIEKENVDFPVIPSSKDELYAEYGLGVMTSDAVKQIPLKLKEVQKHGFKHGEYEGEEKQGPGQFVIDEHGIIIHALKGWLDIDGILSVL
ncbi:MAG: redoxin domain-containing protein [Candidatus Lokiarchaeota archaeon]|nr:redoxin domain-containing protein [Candidatus Lokiarchaeota archaeon]